MSMESVLRTMILSACYKSEQAPNSHRYVEHKVGGTPDKDTELTHTALIVNTVTGGGGTLTLEIGDGVATEDGTTVKFTELSHILVHNKTTGTVALDGGTWAANPFGESLGEEGAIFLSNEKTPYTVSAGETWILTNSGASATTVVVVLVGK